ncbi:MAG: PAS domain-containing protein [Methylophaga sp.]|nr:PAS domain-containing protein [Methylophaga sp.]
METPLSSSKILQAVDSQSSQSIMGDEAWVEVIQQMDTIYTDLIHSQVELEQKNTELEEAHQFIESVLSAMHNILIVTDISGHVLRVNAALEKLMGKNSLELRGQKLENLFLKSASNIKLVKKLSKKIYSGDLSDCEIEILSKEGEPVPMSITSKAHYDHSGKLIGSVLTGRPLGEIRKAYLKLKETHEKLKTTQQKLMQSEKMASLGRLIAGVAHELNNPISFVFGNMYALQRYEERFQQYIEGIHQNISIDERETLRRELRIDRILKDIPSLLEGSLESAGRVKNIVQELRRFSTPGAQNSGPIDLVNLLNKAMHSIIHSSAMTPVVLSDMPDEVIITSNEGYIHQIVINLLQNAIDAIEDVANPMIEFIVKPDDDFIKITVRDNGMGISDGDMLSIFDPFFTTKSVGKGTGLGLYISYGLATEQCNGSLEAGNHRNGGAIFTLRLPNV